MGRGEGDVLLPVPLRGQVLHHACEPSARGVGRRGLQPFPLPSRLPASPLFTLSALLQDDLKDGEDIARCPSCSLRIRVIFDDEALEKVTSAEAK